MSTGKNRNLETARDQVILNMAKGVEALLEAHVPKAPPPVAESLKTVATRLHSGVALLESLVREETDTSVT